MRRASDADQSRHKRPEVNSVCGAATDQWGHIRDMEGCEVRHAHLLREHPKITLRPAPNRVKLHSSRVLKCNGLFVCPPDLDRPNALRDVGSAALLRTGEDCHRLT